LHWRRLIIGRRLNIDSDAQIALHPFFSPLTISGGMPIYDACVDEPISPSIHTRSLAMRMLMNVKIPHKEFNAAVKDGTAGAKLQHILEELKPQAAYFTEQDGTRGAVLVVDMADASQIPAYAEPWFLTFSADVEFRIAMTPEDLKKSGIDKMGKKWT
jgi:hypothetical protein